MTMNIDSKSGDDTRRAERAAEQSRIERNDLARKNTVRRATTAFILKREAGPPSPAPPRPKLSESLLAPAIPTGQLRTLPRRTRQSPPPSLTPQPPARTVLPNDSEKPAVARINLPESAPAESHSALLREQAQPAQTPRRPQHRARREQTSAVQAESAPSNHAARESRSVADVSAPTPRTDLSTGPDLDRIAAIVDRIVRFAAIGHDGAGHPQLTLHLAAAERPGLRLTLTAPRAKHVRIRARGGRAWADDLDALIERLKERGMNVELDDDPL
jgi:hypothetical protein